MRSAMRAPGARPSRSATDGPSPSIVGAPDDDVTIRELEPSRQGAGRVSASVADTRPYGAPDLQTLSTTGTEYPACGREALDHSADLTNDSEIPEKIDGGAERPITPVVATVEDPDATPPEPLSDSDRDLIGNVLAAFSNHPSVARSAKANPVRTPSAQATSRRVAAMIREGVPVDALASATTSHLDDLYRQTRCVVWSPTYCEPAYDRLHSEWTMRRAEERRLRDEKQARDYQWTRWQEEKADPVVAEAVMAKYRLSAPTTDPVRPTGDVAKTDEELRREIDALRAAKGANHDA
jgi:hypothetical protein